MFKYLTMGGEFMLLQLLLFVTIILLSAKKIFELFIKQDLPEYRLAAGLNAILFWGGISVLFGFISHFWGISTAYQRISYAHDVSPAIIAGGYSKSLTTITGRSSFFILCLFSTSLVLEEAANADLIAKIFSFLFIFCAQTFSAFGGCAFRPLVA